jgi:hypothetical protein
VHLSTTIKVLETGGIAHAVAVEVTLVLYAAVAQLTFGIKL